MKLSVIMPVYNEAKSIEEIIRRVLAVDLDKELIIIDDGSNDGTRQILKDKIVRNHLTSNDDLKIIYQPKNQGKGSCIRKGLEYVTGDIVIIQDADLEYDPCDYYSLIQPILENDTSVVYGSRFSYGRNRAKIGAFNRHFIYNRIITFLSNRLFSTDITDEPTCYKVFKQEVIKNISLKCRRFEFCSEITAKIRKMGYKIKEVPISYNPRMLKEGKKVRCLDGVHSLYILLKYKFFD